MKKHRLMVGGMVPVTFFLALTLGFTGCGSDYSKYYNPMKWFESRPSGTMAKHYSQAGADLVKRVVVTPFGSGIKAAAPEADLVYQSLKTSLAKAKEVRLLDFEQLKTQIASLPGGGRSADELILQAGRQKGVSVVISGHITGLGIKKEKVGVYGFRDYVPFLAMEVTLTMVDVGGGTVLGYTTLEDQIQLTRIEAANMENQGEHPPQAKVTALRQKLEPQVAAWAIEGIDGLPWIGTVLRVQGDRVQVNGGAETGLQKDQFLTVFAMGERIKTGSGRVIYLEGPPVGSIRLIEVGPASSWGIMVVGKDQHVKEMHIKPGEKVALQ